MDGPRQPGGRPVAGLPPPRLVGLRGSELSEDDAGLDMDTRTSGYSYLRDWEERRLDDKDHLRSHGFS